jgi:tetratricopeptide (TPR) repeat protein
MAYGMFPTNASGQKTTTSYNFHATIINPNFAFSHSKTNDTMAILHRTHTANNTRIRTQDLSSLSIGLALDRLGKLLCQTLRQHSNDNDLTMMAVFLYESLLHRMQEGESCRLESCSDELSQIVDVLDVFITSTAELPATVVFEVHSLRGLVQETLCRHKLARQSYLKALWIASSTAQIPKEQLAIAMHHLGKSYGASGDYKEATALLERSLSEYEQSHIPKRHVCVADAESSIRRLSAERLAMKSSFSRPKRTTLALIPEE